jgi:glycosyltransferase involved in cell wall biosynthesis
MVTSIERSDCPAATHPRGVSVIVCCHNSARRLAPTLHHLAAQQAGENIPWEVLVVDNASSDGTAGLARSLWPADRYMPLRIIPESRMGLSYARVAGLAAARYEYISFVDDDNWVCPGWIETVAQIFDRDSQVGACGGAIQPVFETEAPGWFARYQGGFAVGNWGPVARYTSYTDIWGAGLSLRQTAWRQLRSTGFSAVLTDRRGKHLTAGGDTEICAALTLLGWKLWYDPRLELQHFMPSERLTWSYLRRLWRGFGHASVALSWYSFALSRKPATWKVRVARGWAWNLFRSIQALVRHRRVLLGVREGDHDKVQAEAVLGKAQALMSGFRAYRKGMRQVHRLVVAAERTDHVGHAVPTQYPVAARPETFR